MKRIQIQSSGGLTTMKNLLRFARPALRLAVGRRLTTWNEFCKIGYAMYNAFTAKEYLLLWKSREHNTTVTRNFRREPMAPAYSS